MSGPRRSLRAASLALALALLAAAGGASALSSLAPYVPGWELLRDEHALAAAAAWTAAAADVAGAKGAQAQLDAAFASVLASLAYEQAGDARSYARWADAVRAYLEAGSSWEMEREALRERWRALDRQLSQSASQPTLGKSDQMLADLVGRLKLLDYRGPRLGLGAARDGSSDLSNVIPQYFAGAGDPSPDAAIAAPQSRYGQASLSPASAAEPAEADKPSAMHLARKSLTEPQIEADPRDAPARTALSPPRRFSARPNAPLGAVQRAAAQRAWRYVAANRQAATGLVNGKDSYPVASVADIAQTIAAYMAALSLQFIDRESFDSDMRRLLVTLRDLPLYNQELFNRGYDSRSGRMLDLGDHADPVGGGWSASDVGRLLLWLKALGNAIPDTAPATGAIVARLRMSRLVEGGVLHSALHQDGREAIVGDLRLGEQQVTAAALSLWGVVLPAMFGYEDAVSVRAAGVLAPGDRRDGGTISPEVFARGVIELGGIDGCFESAALGILAAQHALAGASGRPVMIADELLDRPPWFVHSALAANGAAAWQVVGIDGRPRPELANFSVKAAYLWAAVDSAPRTLAARALAESFERSERGLYGGRYLDATMNLALTLDTNAAVLLAAFYTERGGRPVLRVDNPVDHPCPGLAPAPP